MLNYFSPSFYSYNNYAPRTYIVRCPFLFDVCQNNNLINIALLLSAHPGIRIWTKMIVSLFIYYQYARDEIQRATLSMGLGLGKPSGICLCGIGFLEPAKSFRLEVILYWCRPQRKIIFSEVMWGYTRMLFLFSTRRTVCLCTWERELYAPYENSHSSSVICFACIIYWSCHSSMTLRKTPVSILAPPLTRISGCMAGGGGIRWADGLTQYSGFILTHQS